MRPANCASSTSRCSICWIDSYVARASSECQSYDASARTAPAVSSGIVASSISAQPRVVALLAGELVALRGERLVERGADLVEGAAEVAATARRVAHPAHPGGEVVEPAVAVEAAPHQVAQRLAQRPAREHVAADRVEQPRGRRTAVPAGRARRATGRSGTGDTTQAP